MADDEHHATELARLCLAVFQGNKNDWGSPDQAEIYDVIPRTRKFGYDIRQIITTLADHESFIELKNGFGGAIVTGFMRLEGRAIGVIANDCSVLGGAIDIAAGEKAADFMNLCAQFSIPLLSLADTPGFMVGPDHEEMGAVRRLSRVFTAGAKTHCSARRHSD